MIYGVKCSSFFRFFVISRWFYNTLRHFDFENFCTNSQNAMTKCVIIIIKWKHSQHHFRRMDTCTCLVDTDTVVYMKRHRRNHNFSSQNAQFPFFRFYLTVFAKEKLIRVETRDVELFGVRFSKKKILILTGKGSESLKQVCKWVYNHEGPHEWLESVSMPPLLYMPHWKVQSFFIR